LKYLILEDMKKGTKKTKALFQRNIDKGRQQFFYEKTFLGKELL